MTRLHDERTRLTRRGFALGLCTLPFLAQAAGAQASLPKMTVTRDPSCGCCGGWVDYLRQAGFTVEVVERPDLAPLKRRLGVPNELASCHTAEIGGYVIEGHVPEQAIRRLLAERPLAKGIAVPGMPASSPGMDVPGAGDAYDVILFGPAGRKRFARFRGREEIAL
jgi:hypothetical protein